ncbi:DUF1493 family protein [Erwinia psidii]|uniref:DUF1493 family protein n=1 Tax=Erwinia psidii TaxID=69224 RepID=UPI00226B217D|nr:DUF1493 family protein [Erwinia psidii]MCX8961544.1 DUF1493 family protein [Erwinia psidii]
MVDDIEKQIYKLVRRHDGVYLFKCKEPVLTRETDLDTDLRMEEEEAEELMNEFFSLFDVEKGHFDIKTYYPDEPFSWNPFHKYTPIQVPDFTIGMLIESAKAGRWLY